MDVLSLRGIKSLISTKILGRTFYQTIALKLLIEVIEKEASNKIGRFFCQIIALKLFIEVMEEEASTMLESTCFKI